jgi:N-acetylglutamate synthase-like GNAT family acetyltransferase
LGYTWQVEAVVQRNRILISLPIDNMKEVLENPIWHALNSGNKHLASGDGSVRFFPEEVTTFVGLENFTENEFLTLYDIVPPNSVRATFSPPGTNVPEPWQKAGGLQIYQMIYSGTGATCSGDQIKPLSEKDIPEMTELTRLTNPGPFRSRTIDFGNFHGIFEDGKLAAMAGQRLKPYEYTEISAVCTHPEHRGKGLAKQLLLFQIALIKSAGSIPFLHVATTNDAAIRLYQSMGFVTKRTLSVIIFRKN